MVEIECLLCEKPIKLPKYIDSEDYEGEVVCQECQSLFYIKLVKSKVRKYRIEKRGFRELSAEEVMEIMAKSRQEMIEGKQEEK